MTRNKGVNIVLRNFVRSPEVLLVSDVFLQLLVFLAQSLHVNFDLFYFFLTLLSGVADFVLFNVELSFDVNHVFDAALSL